MSGGDTPATADRQRFDALTEAVRRHQTAYYELDAPSIPDAEYDRLVAELEELARRHPEWVSTDAPIVHVGGSVRSDLAPVHFAVPVLSLNNVRSRDELAQFITRINEPGPYVVELKIDGLSVVLQYRRGRLTLAATRGTGDTGEDVTANVRQIRDVPAELPEPIDLEVRGEVYLSRSRFLELNRERAARGESLLANPRNAAAGSLRQLDPNVTAERQLSAFCYEIRAAPVLPATQHAALERLAALGFPVEPNWRRCDSLDEIWQYVSYWEQRRAQLDYDTDGLVVKLDDLERSRSLGATQKAPRAQVAFKYPPDEDVTVVTGIRLTVGRTGAVTPTAELAPVRLGGTTVTRASLHNASFLERLDVRVGDHVVVRKAGEIIPEIVSVLVEARQGNEPVFRYPTTCPECGTLLVREPDDVEVRCPATLTCPAQRREGLIHYGSRGALDIAGLGEKTVDLLLSEHLVDSPADLYALEADRLQALPRLGPVAAANLVRAIQASRGLPLSRLLVALGIRHVGERVAEALAEQFGSLDALMAASADEVAQVPGVGPVIAQSVAAFFQAPRNRALVAALREAGVNFLEPPREPKAAGPWSGEVVVITGVLAASDRKTAQAAVEQAGGRVQDAVTRATTLVVAGDRAGSKLARARQLGIPVIDEQEFWARMTNGRTL